MTAPAFVDTNILLYSIDGTAPRKAEIAAAILERNDLILSVQVLQEFIVQATSRHKSWAVPFDTAAAMAATWRRFRVVESSLALFERSLVLCARYRLSYWDSSIVAAAVLSGVDTLLSEDMQHGQVIEGVRIVNPFRA